MAKKVEKKHSNSPGVNLVLGLLALGACYGFGSWAIDSGSLWHYAFAFASFAFAVHYLKLTIKQWLKINDKAKAAGKSKS